MAMMVVLAAVLLSYGVSTGNAMKMPSKPGAVAGENSELPLDMAKNSVDDMYDKCKDKMKEKATRYLENEKNKDKKFKEVWDSTEEYVLNNFNEGKTDLLEKYQLVALYYYTSGKNNAYRDFNDKVRTQRPEYKTNFGYHALHFHLTTAIQTLQKERKMNKKCLTGYRRVNLYFSQDVQNKEIRFGAFTSASTEGYLNKNKFGDKSCFEILTCMGADISHYSKFKESEVLIPPYEVFKVVKIKKRTKQKPDLPCEVVYKVESTRSFSNLNCTLVTK
ncbi:ecto-ADP-ribosyltransferase 5 isoform X1 [Etheostoma spectabile]|uniref:ecto-ADP-ribosyltransferase 5 isoform X1 n=1 Tax=Etheostoma spectabile TaxID=54343 RepID=UPI0013AF8AEB|nr:ecto-ADP-ribosyltransferase 5-like isoform X1 [Etheostoma spectabile]XP_032371268.1 ecto-ADP-ribosyltransferase 5-like isoform X1 [Etheostoma spectabile]